MIVKTSMSSKTHASDKPPQAQPALPQRLPPRWPIRGTAQKSSQLSHTVDKLLDALHGPRAQQSPFQSLHLLALGLLTPGGAMFLVGYKLPLSFLLARRLRLPYVHHPHRQGITSGIRAFIGGKQLHSSPTDLH